MPLATLIMLVGIMAGIVWLQVCPSDKKTVDGRPADFSRVPYFLRYNAPVRQANERHVVPTAGAPVATGTPVAPAGSGFAGFNPRVV